MRQGLLDEIAHVDGRGQEIRNDARYGQEYGAHHYYQAQNVVRRLPQVVELRHL